MVEEQGTIIKIEEDYAVVRTQRRSACGNCGTAKTGCATAVIGEVIGQKDSDITVVNSLNAKVGDTVIIGLEEQALLKGSFLLYIVPLIFLFVSAICVEVLATNWGFTQHDGLTALGGILGLVAGLGVVNVLARNMMKQQRYQPVLLNIVSKVNLVQLSH